MPKLPPTWHADDKADRPQGDANRVCWCGISIREHSGMELLVCEGVLRRDSKAN